MSFLAAASRVVASRDLASQVVDSRAADSQVVQAADSQVARAAVVSLAVPAETTAETTANDCGVTSGQISALTPLLDKLGLSTTVDGVKQLVDKLLGSVSGLLESQGVNGSGGLIDTVDNLVQGLLGSSLNLHNTVTALASILENQVPCLLDTVLPKP
ncbi:hypothetical protein GGF46_004237 [Coemansia sp. RSA 552]|nr:hypothetical protein GGF46_004237 [Coemansia sp. RSA 552]